jgi:hypothetical protein
VSSRLRVRFVLVVAALAAVVAANPNLARAAGVDFWNLGEARAALAAATEESVALSHRDDTVLRRIVIKEDLVADLLAGRTDLAAVAARFLELNADEPAYLEVLRASVRGDSDLERSARNVIEYCGQRVSDPAAFAALQTRLEAELERMQDADHPAVR